MDMLLSKHIANKVKAKNVKLALSKNGETVIEHMISHVVALCMYKYTMKYVSGPLLQLVDAITTRIDSGAVDAVHHHCQYSLDENCLLPIDVTGENINLSLVVDEEKQEIVKVNSCDTLFQVKQKLLNVMFKEQPFSKRPNVSHVQLEWRVNVDQRIILQDTDLQTERKLKTIADFGIQNNAVVAFVDVWKEDINASDQYDTIKQPIVARYETNIYQTSINEDGTFHILEGNVYTGAYDAMDGEKPNIDESIFERLTETKQIYQQHVDSIMNNVFSSSSNNIHLPLFVKYLFDFLDNMATKHGVSINELKIWKNNSLAEMFWLRILRNPAYVCDIQQTPPIDITLGVISAVFRESWSIELFGFKKSSPSHRQMYVKEIPRYRQLVTKFYSDIKHTPTCDRMNVIDEVNSLIQPFSTLFKKSSVLVNLHSFTVKYLREVKDAFLKGTNRNESTVEVFTTKVSKSSSSKEQAAYVNSEIQHCRRHNQKRREDLGVIILSDDTNAGC
ncbi:plexin-A4-like [Antedon mediterranea]|uniref:plexin-A4-like n=1 Tax=Antedon mediterranea TaxID=105859 RepID=UPI003AF88002